MEFLLSARDKAQQWECDKGTIPSNPPSQVDSLAEEINIHECLFFNSQIFKEHIISQTARIK